MSARSLAAGSFAPVAEPAVPADAPAPADRAAAIAFREALWREYRREALNAGLSLAQASAYASALSLEPVSVAGVPEMAPAGPGWFYQGRPQLVRRTLTSGLIDPARPAKSNATGRPTGATISILLPPYRWWNAGEKS
jgi:hypothetical protein